MSWQPGVGSGGVGNGGVGSRALGEESLLQLGRANSGLTEEVLERA